MSSPDNGRISKENEMNYQGKARHPVEMDASIAGPLFMLSAALMFTLLNVFVKLLGPAFTVWHIGFFRFSPPWWGLSLWETPRRCASGSGDS